MANKPLTDEEWALVDKEINAILRPQLKVYDWARTRGLIKDTAFGTQKVTHWFYKDVPWPRVTTTFREKPEALAGLDSAEHKVFGFQQGIYLDKKMIAAARMGGQRDISLDQYTIKLERLGQAIECAILLGTAHKDTSPDLSITGIFNDASINNVAAGGCGLGSDDDMTAIGDFVHSIPLFLSKLYEDNHFGPFDWFLTPGLMSQLTKNYNATTYETEYDIVKRTFEGVINFPPIVTKFMGENTAALTTTNQEMMFVDARPQNFVIKQTLPLGRRKWSTEKEGDEAFGVEWEAAIQKKRPTAACSSTTLITATAY